ncbi:hypothetical protein AC579_3500 [Pseudocercospora musae]|uniref:Uncharacterized protein n=1 Tax=Pseudocercospora musae TaxID=113226 RepID=A0A139I3F5_9PEZI|nr:hypothetical protein AC579_3500 [Pseudocercospora musae]
MFSSRVGHDAQHRVDGNRVRWQSHTFVPVPDKTAMNTEETLQNKNSSAGASSNGPLLPARDSQQRGIWVGYASPRSQKAASGFDCPIRAGPDGRQKCGWRPRDGTDGFVTMSRVREHVAFHGLICPDCGNCFRASKRWKQHRDYRRRNGVCLKCGYDTSKPQHPLELNSHRIDHFFKSQPQNGPAKRQEEMWLEGFMALFPNWREHFTELPSALYRLNVQREAEAQTIPNLDSSPISSDIASPCATGSQCGSQCPKGWSQESMDPGSVMSIDEMLQRDISENGITPSTPTALASQQSYIAGYEAFPWDASTLPTFHEDLPSPVISQPPTSLPTINPEYLSSPSRSNALHVPSSDQNSVARRLSDSAEATQAASMSKTSPDVTNNLQSVPLEQTGLVVITHSQASEGACPNVNDTKKASTFTDVHLRGVSSSLGSQDSSGGILQHLRKLTLENEKLHARVEELESAMATMRRRFASERDELHSRIKELELVPARIQRRLKNLVVTLKAAHGQSRTPEERRQLYTEFVNDMEALGEEDDSLQS